MPPGFSCLLKTTSKIDSKNAVAELDAAQVPNNLFAKASWSDFNHLLFKCDNEEMDIS